MPTEDFIEGVNEGWRAAMERMAYNARVAGSTRKGDDRKTARRAYESPKPKRKASAYSKKYGRAFKKVAPKYKKKNGSWAKDGFKRAQKAAHKLAKK